MTRSQQSINLTLLYAAFYESVFLSFGIIPLCLMILAYDKINSTMNKTVTQHCLSDLPQIRVQVTHVIANTESSKRACTSIGFEICATVCNSLVVCHKSKAVKCSTRLSVITKQLSFLPVVELCECVCVCVCVCLSVCLSVTRRHCIKKTAQIELVFLRTCFP